MTNVSGEPEKISSSRRAVIFSALLAAVGIAPFVALAAFIHPFSDDYWFLHEVSTRGPINLAGDLYLLWTGRYLSNFLLSLIFGLLLSSGRAFLSVYRIIPVLLIASITSSAWFAIRAWTRPHLDRIRSLSLAVLFTAGLLAGMPSTASGLYWLPGSFTYTGSAVLLLLVLGLAADLTQVERVPDAKKWVGGGMIIFLAAGMNELAAMSTVLLAAIIVARNLTNSSTRLYSAALLATALASTAAVILAPGNANRLSHEPIGLSPLVALGTGWLDMFLFSLTEQPAAVLVMFLLAVLVMTELPARKREVTWMRLLLGPLAVIALLTVLLFPVLWGYGEIPDRILDFAYFTYLVGAALVASDMASFAASRLAKHQLATLRKYGTAIAAPVLLILLLFTTNSSVAWRDLLSGDATSYRETWRQRAEEVAAAKRDGLDRAEISPLIKEPTTIIFARLDANPLYWPNKYYAEFMGLKIVRVADGKPWPTNPEPVTLQEPQLRKD